MADTFALPPAVELMAQAIGAASGAMLGLRKGYDVVGVSALALATGAGGGIIRDCLLQVGPPVFLTNSTSLLIQLASAVAVIALFPFVRRFAHHLTTWFTLLDAISLSLFAIVGMVKAQSCGLAWPAVVLLGVITAAGGGVLRDVLSREEPLMFRPGQFYTVAALSGCLLFALLCGFQLMEQGSAGILCAGVILVVRMGSVRFGWTTSRSAGDQDKPPGDGG